MKKGPHPVLYDRTNTERLSAVEFGTLRPDTSSQEIVVWLWNKKDFADAPTATDEAWETDAGLGAEGDAAAMWQMERLTSRTLGVYDGKVKRDESKHTAFYVELIYPSKLGMNYSLTTPTTILPPEEAPTQVMEPESSLLQPASRPTPRS